MCLLIAILSSFVAASLIVAIASGARLQNAEERERLARANKLLKRRIRELHGQAVDMEVGTLERKALAAAGYHFCPLRPGDGFWVSPKTQQAMTATEALVEMHGGFDDPVR